MNQKTTKAIARLVALLLVGALVITSITFVFSWADTSEAEILYAASAKDPDWDKELKDIKDFIVKIKDGYKDDVPYNSLIQGVYEGIIHSLDDPYSVFYSSEDESRQFEESVSGEFYGVGVHLEQIGGVCKVVAPIAGSPSEKAGVLSGDVVVAVDGEDVTEKSIEQIVNLLKGSKDSAGTKVSMTVLRSGNRLTLSMIREKIKLASVSHELLDGKIGYIRISQFDNDSHLEFKDAKLRLLAGGAESFIVDVRNNPGGYVGTAADICQQLMPKGPIVHFQNQGETIETIYADGRGNLNMPVVVLVNEGSASASEILAAAWKDSGTARLVGTQTFGKGVAQQMITSSGGDSVKLSMYYFLSPNMNQINDVGVTPDFFVKNYVNMDEQTQIKLYEEYKKFAPMNEKNKPGKGDTGLNVFGAQQRLSLLGYELKTSGIVDEKTWVAVKRFQRDNNLFPYGVLDYSTMALLEKTVTEYITGDTLQKDLQLERAIELLM